LLHPKTGEFEVLSASRCQQDVNYISLRAVENFGLMELVVDGILELRILINETPNHRVAIHTIWFQVLDREEMKDDLVIGTRENQAASNDDDFDDTSMDDGQGRGYRSKSEDEASSSLGVSRDQTEGAVGKSIQTALSMACSDKKPVPWSLGASARRSRGREPSHVAARSNPSLVRTSNSGVVRKHKYANSHSASKQRRAPSRSRPGLNPSDLMSRPFNENSERSASRSQFK
jgi:hypothetical protein